MSLQLPAELDALIFFGQTRRGEDENVGEFALELAVRVKSGELTEAQGRALASVLGLGQGELYAALTRAQGPAN